MTTTAQSLEGLFKEVYASYLENLVPEAAKLINTVNFVPADKETGNAYHQPVIVAQEHGFTYAGFDAGAFALNPSIAMRTQDAQVRGNQILLRSAISYDAAARASRGGPKAFKKATQVVVENMYESTYKRVEISCFYGETGLGQTASFVNVSATSTTVTFATGTWAAGIWTGAENATLQFFDNTGTLISTGTDSVFTIGAVDSIARTLTLTGSAAGITALEAGIVGGSAPLDAFYNGAKNNEMDGLDRILTNTGTLFNIDASLFNLWKSNIFDAGNSKLTFDKLTKGITLAVNRGLDEGVTAYLNPGAWNSLNSDLAAVRMFDQSYSRSKLENGTEAITYYGQNGKIDIIPHNIIKEGESFILPTRRLKRIGAQDVSFKTPGLPSEDIFRQLENQAGFEFRVYTDQSIFFETPARGVKIFNINSGL